MVTTTRIPASTVSGRRSLGSILGQLLSWFVPRPTVITRADRERHHRVRRERADREQRSARAELALLYLGVRR